MPLTDIEKLAHHLLSRNTDVVIPPQSKPLAVAHRFDGSLKVIASTGQKFIFPVDMVQKAVDELKPVSKSVPKTTKPPSKAAQKAPRVKKTG